MPISQTAAVATIQKGVIPQPGGSPPAPERAGCEAGGASHAYAFQYCADDQTSAPVEIPPVLLFMAAVAPAINARDGWWP